LLLAVAGVLTTVFMLLLQSPPALQVSQSDAARDVPLGSTFTIAPRGWDPQIESVTLSESPITQPGSAGTVIPLQLETISEGREPGQTEVLARPMQALRPDSSYRLSVHSSAYEAAFPLPRRASVERQVSFTTPTSPKPTALAEPARLKWEEPLPIRWNLPISEFSYEVTPAAETRAWVDEQDRSKAFVTILDPREATTYQIVVNRATSLTGIALQSPTTFSVITPHRPRFVGSADPRTHEFDQPLPLSWNVPLEHLNVTVEPPVDVAWQIDPRDPKKAEVQFTGLQQGASYRLTVDEALAPTGAALAEPVVVELNVPAALAVEDLSPEEGEKVSIKARPMVQFNEPVRDRRAAEAAISIEPKVSGRFEWVDDREVRFVPTRDLPPETNFALLVKAGPDGARTVSGGFLEQAWVRKFTTFPNKTIDVSISQQSMTLFEGERAVRTLPVGTGLPGADTPLGEFRVQYKMRTAHFRGVNTATGGSYDLQNVNYVLAFLGDYTIHGAYWRQQFGQRGSNGCVSLSDPDAKVVYDWAPEGTLIRIHM
jgi:lipoprotein-anchoring transpeptidase ErfK/SrfK